MISDGHFHLVSQGPSGNDGLPGNKGFKVGTIQIMLIIIDRFFFFCTVILNSNPNPLVFRGFQEVQVSQVWLDEKVRRSVLVIM